MQLNLLGKRWNLRFVKRIDKSGSRGLCDAPDDPKKRIHVLKTLAGQELLEILLHEMTHAADWSKDEAFVERFAADVAAALWKLGYRKTE
jgi:hypothetical protein